MKPSILNIGGRGRSGWGRGERGEGDRVWRARWGEGDKSLYLHDLASITHVLINVKLPMIVRS